MKIEWLGNSTFFISTKNGKKILIDPFDILSLSNSNLSADYITFSKQKKINNINTNNIILCNGENYCDNDLKISCLFSNGDSINGSKRGPNYIYTYEFDNLKICHLGYVGEMLNETCINNLKNSDILFLPIGGNYCISGTIAAKLSKELCAKFIIPMCYKCTSNQFYFDGPKDYLKNTNNIVTINKSFVFYSDLPKSLDHTTIFFKTYTNNYVQK